jgi:hypothetical protein
VNDQTSLPSHRPRPAATGGVPSGWRRAGLVAVKGVHTGIFAAVSGAILYLLTSGLRGRSDRRAGLAGAVVAAEVLIFTGNGWRCPLTGLAEDLGAEDGSVTDIYLPPAVASHIPHITIPLVTVAILAHARNLRSASGPVGQRWAEASTSS